MANLEQQQYGIENPAALSALIDHEEKRDIVRRYFEAYKYNDLEQLEPLLAHELRFTSPEDNALDLSSYLERCWPMHLLIKDIIVRYIFVEGSNAFVNYTLFLYDGRQFHNTEFMTIENGKITDIAVFFGPTFKDGKFQSSEADTGA